MSRACSWPAPCSKLCTVSDSLRYEPSREKLNTSNIVSGLVRRRVPLPVVASVAAKRAAHGGGNAGAPSSRRARAESPHALQLADRREESVAYPPLSGSGSMSKHTSDVHVDIGAPNTYSVGSPTCRSPTSYKYYYYVLPNSPTDCLSIQKQTVLKRRAYRIKPELRAEQAYKACMT